jgi:hypothetical protein
MAAPDRPYEIWAQPIFVTDDGTEYPFEGLLEDQQETRGANSEFRFIVDTLRSYFGDALDFKVNATHLVLTSLSKDQMKLLREINEDSCDVYVKYGHSHLTFDVDHIL